MGILTQPEPSKRETGMQEQIVKLLFDRLKGHLNFSNYSRVHCNDHTFSVSEIKGAPCTRRAHFHGRVHNFRRCAPGVCTFFEPFNIAIYLEGAWSNFRVHIFMESAPCECTK